MYIQDRSLKLRFAFTSTKIIQLFIHEILGTYFLQDLWNYSKQLIHSIIKSHG